MLLGLGYDRHDPTTRRAVFYRLNMTNKAVNDEYIVKFTFLMNNRKPLGEH
jgi:hypothetical protein